MCNFLLVLFKNSKIIIYEKKGEGYIGLGEYSNAISSFDKAIELEPSNQLFKYLKSTKLKSNLLVLEISKYIYINVI